MRYFDSLIQLIYRPEDDNDNCRNVNECKNYKMYLLIYFNAL